MTLKRIHGYRTHLNYFHIKDNQIENVSCETSLGRHEPFLSLLTFVLALLQHRVNTRIYQSLFLFLQTILQDQMCKMITSSCFSLCFALPVSRFVDK